jgi:hypothetical protein
MGRWAILNGVLVLIVLLLGLQIARTWSRTLRPVEPVARGVDPGVKDQDKPDGKTGGGRRGGKRGANEKVEQPTMLVTTIVNKDLFDPSRQKPSEETKAPPPKEVGPPPNLTLVGVRMIGRDHEILVTDAGQGNQQKRLRIGDQLGGYTLNTIAPNRVTLAAASGDVVTLTLAVDKSGGAAAPTTPGAPRPPGAPQRPGQPAAPPASPPAAGVHSPAAAAGIQPRGGPPAPAVRPGRPAGPGGPPTPGVPGAPGTPAAMGTPQAAGVPAAPSGPPAAGIVPPAVPPNIPAAVRQKLEQLKGN